MTTPTLSTLFRDCFATTSFCEPLPFEINDARRSVLERVWGLMAADYEGDALLNSYVDRLIAAGAPPIEAHRNTAVVGLEPQDELPWLTRAALLAASALQFREEVLSSTLPEAYRCGFSDPLEASPYECFFSSCLAPGEQDGDGAQWNRERSSHLIVLSGGRAVAVEVLRDGLRADAASLLAAFKEIVADDGPPAPWPAGMGLLSTLGIDEWSATMRRLAASESGRRAVADLNSALFVVALDHPVAERAAPLKDPGVRMHAGDPGNRWYNAGINLVVNDEGQAGVLLNIFAGIPGVPAATFASYLFDRVATLRSELEHPPTPLLRRACPLELTQAEQSRLEARKVELAASQLLRDGTSEVDVTREDFSAIRHGWGCAMLSAYYCASHRLWGDDFSLSFLLSVKALREGALFIVPARLPAIGELVDAIDRGESAGAIRSKLERAAADYGRVVTAAQSGVEVHSLMWLLLLGLPMYATDEELALFPPMPESDAHRIRASNIPDLPGVRYVGRFVPAPLARSIWVHYRALRGRTQLVVQPGEQDRERCDEWRANVVATLRTLRDAMR
ncbi:MAG: choline/carnitine O-acyltransferase [Deltaproteobacteria bacterium]|nr:choline/carnitine O-acyltransferase [Deltaproteobacteria bacterium]